jgi:GNAT superfamily N-acetyltransferase
LIDIKRALPDDAGAIKLIKDAVWPDDATSEAYIRQIIAQPDHVIHLAETNGVPSGLVEGFLTLSSEGMCRWEVDLLAVHPDFRKQGIATWLIQTCVQAGREMGAEQFRALIHVDNMTSQQSFMRNDFYRGDDPSTLCTSAETAADPVALRALDGLHLIPVATLNYRGVWLEGQIDTDGLRLAQAVCAHHKWDVAGAVISHNQQHVITAAESCGYSVVGQYERWYL